MEDNNGYQGYMEPRGCCASFINTEHKETCENYTRSCCRTKLYENHEADCPVMKKLDESFKKDFSGERWHESYVTRNTENMRKH